MGAVQRPRGARRRRDATSPCSSPSRCRDRVSYCPIPATCPARSASAAVMERSSASTRCRPAWAAPDASSPASTGPSSPTCSPSPSRCRAATCRSTFSAALLDPRGRLRYPRARHLGRFDLRAGRHGDGRRTRHPGGAPGSRSRCAKRSPGRSSPGPHAAARRGLRRGQGGAWPRAHVGDRVRRAAPRLVPVALPRGAPGGHLHAVRDRSPLSPAPYPEPGGVSTRSTCSRACRRWSSTRATWNGSRAPSKR